MLAIMQQNIIFKSPLKEKFGEKTKINYKIFTERCATAAERQYCQRGEVWLQKDVLLKIPGPGHISEQGTGQGYELSDSL